MPAPRPKPLREDDGQINRSEVDPAMGELNEDTADAVTPDSDPNRPLG